MHHAQPLRSIPFLLTGLLAAACATDPETASTEQAATALRLECGGASHTVVDRSVWGRQWPANVIDGGIIVEQRWMSKTPGYSEKLYDTREEAERDLPEVCESFGSAVQERLLQEVGDRAKAACEGALFRAFVCEECENGAGDKCEQEIREGSCEWRPGVEPSLSASSHITVVEPPVNPDIRVIVPPQPRTETEPVQPPAPAPGTKYKGDCLVTVTAAARITDNRVGCGQANSCD